MGKKDKKGKLTKKLQDRMSKFPDWKKAQRNQIKKYIKWCGETMSEKEGTSKKEKRIEREAKPKPHTKKERKEKRMKKRIKEETQVRSSLI